MTLPFHIDLSGKTAVVTGATGVLCADFARALHACGANVALLGRDEMRGRALESELSAKGGRAKFYPSDVLDAGEMKGVAALVGADFGPCDILVNGAGGNSPKATTDKEYYDVGDIDADTKSFFDLDLRGVRDVFDLNFLGTLIPTQCFARKMGAGAVIVNVSSMNAFTPLTKIPAYSGAKAAVSNFTQWLAVHFSRAGIRVNAIAPGFFITNQNRAMMFDDSGKPSARAEKILAGTPIGRFGEPNELIGALLFLVSNEASGFVTGVVLPVDGGFSAYSGV
ncbi:SDR family oxidoreductase [Oscillospiraceae bacterium OttesenSCG-928-G22]|nr:SDR family oxidoreductase [Oscillospiraceae bacterium OttesenSCG-928-G22]